MQEKETKKKNVSKKKAIAIYLFSGTWLVFIGVGLPSFHASNVAWHRSGINFFPLIFGLFLYLLCAFIAFPTFFFSNSGNDQVFDNKILQRARDRYSSEIQQLNSLGFTYAFTESETSSIFRLFLIFPLIVLFIQFYKRDVLAIGNGWKKLFVIPIYSSSDGRTFAHPLGLGVKFQTAFRNGQLLVTKNFHSASSDPPMYLVQASKGTISETWQKHQNCLDRLDTESNPANRDRSYDAYVAISKQESVFQRRQM